MILNCKCYIVFLKAMQLQSLHVLMTVFFSFKRASWAQSQRSQYRKITKYGEIPDTDSGEEKKGHQLTEDRRNRLSDIGFEWFVAEEIPAVSVGETTVVARTAYDDQWDTMYERFCAFQHRYSHCLVPKRYEDAKL